MDEKEKTMAIPHWTKAVRILFGVLIILSIGLLFYSDISRFVSILIVVLGFSAVVFIHELGHFIAAKVTGMKVEAFSIGFSPILLAFQKTRTGVRIRFLPTSSDYGKNKAPEGEEKISDKVDDSATDYRIGLIPFGGYVKILGQEDIGTAKRTDDPRAFTSKSTWAKVLVVACGVTFNAISAILIFMGIFLAGIDLPPAVVGGVQPNSPADMAGLHPGDRILAVDGDRALDFTSIMMAGALSKKGESVTFQVQRSDGRVEEIDIIAKEPAVGRKMRLFGIMQPESLRIAEIGDPTLQKWLREEFGIRANDVIIACNGAPVHHAWELNDAVADATADEAVLTLRRGAKDGEPEFVTTEIPLQLPATVARFDTGPAEGHVFTMVPRLKVAYVEPDSGGIEEKKGIIEKIKFWEKDTPAEAALPAEQTHLQAGDVILRIRDVENPTWSQLREVTTESKGEPVELLVLREDTEGQEVPVEVTLTPMYDHKTDRVLLGIIPVADAEHAVVAKTVGVSGGPAALEIPSGARIVRVDGREVQDYFDVIRIIRESMGQRISLDYRLSNEIAGAVSLDIPATEDYITAEHQTALVQTEAGPLSPLVLEALREKYKAENPLVALQMGVHKTWTMIAQTYVTLKGLLTRQVSPELLSGPIGIVKVSYQLVRHSSMQDFIYFMGLISAIIAVMNLLPIPIMDGGVIVLLIIERIKGSPINPRVQAAMNYIAAVLLLLLFIWLTYRDIFFL